MASDKRIEIRRSDLKKADVSATAKITDVKNLASYNWIEKATPTISVPGIPPLWSPLKGPQRLKKDSGHVYIAQNAARHPESPLEPLFRALFLTDPSFDIHSTHVITDRNNIRKLLSFASPSPEPGNNDHQPFAISVEVVKDTAIFCRQETASEEYIGPNEFRGFGHEFEKAYTSVTLAGSTGHHRIISYRFGGLNMIVRHETDGYVGVSKQTSLTSSGKPDGDILSGMLGSLSLGPTLPTSAKLTVREEGQVVPRESTLEIKTRVSHRRLEIADVAPQLWVSQTPKLVRAYHQKGIFTNPEWEDVSEDIKKWEDEHQEGLKKLSALIRKVIDAAKELGGNAIVRYDGGIVTGKLVVQRANGKKMLPEDLYTKWEVKEDAKVGKSE